MTMLATTVEHVAILRTDQLAFVQKCFADLCPNTTFYENWHHEALRYELDRILTGENKRLVVNLPPRSLKSLFVSVAFPAFVLGKNPHRKIICASYSQDLAIKHASDFRKIIESPWYRKLFPSSIPFKNTETEYQTTSGGFRYTTSVGGTLTGRGGDIIIVDDPLSADDGLSKTCRDKVNAWFGSTLLPRLDDKSAGAIIVVMQRLHQDDLSGFLLDQGGWRHVKFPAIAQTNSEVPLSATRKHVWTTGALLHPARESLSELNALKLAMGTDFFTAQYLQDPVPEIGNLLKRAWLRSADVMPVRQDSDQIVQSWDTAMKATDTADFSVCLTFLVRNRNQYYLIDVYRDRPEFPDLAKLVVSHAQRYQASTVLIEDRVSGTSLIQVARQNGLQGVIGMRPSSDKVSRMLGQTPKLEAGSLYLPKSAPWLDEFTTEYLAFPKGRHDDQIDALSQFLEWRENQQYAAFECDWGLGDNAIPSPYLLMHLLGRG